VWGFFVVPEKYLLLFPLSFSILWLLYSIKKANMTIRRIRMLEGSEPKFVEIVTYTMWGGSRVRVVPRAMINPILDDNTSKTQQFIEIYQPSVLQKSNSTQNQTVNNGPIPSSNTSSHWVVKRYIVDLKRGKICSNTFFNLIPRPPPRK
jgi:hypothetical protein